MVTFVVKGYGFIPSPWETSLRESRPRGQVGTGWSLGCHVKPPAPLIPMIFLARSSRVVRKPKAQAISAMAFGATLLVSSSLGADPVPALNTPVSAEHLNGKFEWADLLTNNPGAEAKFYTQLFGWSAVETTKNDRTYEMLKNGPAAIGEIIQHSKKHQGDSVPRWVGFLATDNIADSVSAVEKNGGKVLAKPRAVSALGIHAIVADSSGAVFGLLQSSSGDLPDFQAAPGELVWAELFSADPKSSAHFYEGVFHYQSSVDTLHPDQQHLILASGEMARAGVSPSPPWEGGKDDWLLFVCVSDVAATAQKAAQFGGTVLVQPHEAKHGGQIAVLADPLGGVIGILEAETAHSLEKTP